MKKGAIQMSVGIIIALVLGLILLAGLLTFWINAGSGGADSLSCSASFQSGCNNYVIAGGCSNDSVVIGDYISTETMECGAGTRNVNEVERICCFE